MVDELLAADRAFAAAGAKTSLVDGVSAMFADDVVMTSPAGLVNGKAGAVESLRGNPVNTGARIAWTPVGAGLSADGRHGYTYGFMTLHRADGTKQPLKYLAYWQKLKEGWRVSVYKRTVGKGEPPQTMTAAVLPERLVPPSTDATTIEQHRESLAQAERDFSRDAQTMGIGPAFKKYGSARAINLGGGNVEGVVSGNEAIGQAVGGGSTEPTSPVSWGPEKAIVASSGDFGVTIGYIVGNKPGPDGKTVKNAFFTIWRRDSLAAPWRYIAE